MKILNIASNTRNVKLRDIAASVVQSVSLDPSVRTHLTLKRNFSAFRAGRGAAGPTAPATKGWCRCVLGRLLPWSVLPSYRVPCCPPLAREQHKTGALTTRSTRVGKERRLPIRH
jgi:hypothetical protein